MYDVVIPFKNIIVIRWILLYNKVFIHISNHLKKMLLNNEFRLKEVTGLIREAEGFTSDFLGISYKPLSISNSKGSVFYPLYATPALKLGEDYQEIEVCESSNKKKVRKKEKEYKKKGLDTLVARVTAYMQEDVVLTDKILEDDNVEVVNTVIHELIHTVIDIYLPLEESITSTLSSLATIKFYEITRGASSLEYEKAVKEDIKLKKSDILVVKYYNWLDFLYKTSFGVEEKLKMKEHICKEAQEALDKTSDYTVYDINNASMTYYMTYSKYGKEVREVCEKSKSLEDAMNLFRTLPLGEHSACRILKEFINESA